MNEIFYAIQMQVDGFGHDTATMICFRTKNECEDWLDKNAERISKNWGYPICFEIVKQRFGTDFEEIFGQRGGKVMKVWLVIDGDGKYNYEVLAVFDNKTAAINYAVESQYELLADTEFEKSYEEIQEDILTEKWEDVCIREMTVRHSY